MATSTREKSQAPTEDQTTLADAPEESDSPAPPVEPEAAPRSRDLEDLTPDERATVSRHYKALRLAVAPGDQEEARERIRSIMGPDAEIGDHVVTLANGEQHRMEYAGSTRHNGIPILGVYEHPL